MAATQMSLTAFSSTTSTVVDPEAWPAGNATDGNLFPNGGKTLLGMYNDGASSRTVALALTAVDGQAVTPKSITIAAGVIRYIILGDPKYYGTNTLATPSHIEVKLAGYTL